MPTNHRTPCRNESTAPNIGCSHIPGLFGSGPGSRSLLSLLLWRRLEVELRWDVRAEVIAVNSLEGRGEMGDSTKTDAGAGDEDTDKDSKTPQMQQHQHASSLRPVEGGSAAGSHHDMRPAPGHANEVAPLPPRLTNYCPAEPKRGKRLSARDEGRPGARASSSAGVVAGPL